MGYLSRKQLESMGFKSIGDNVKISDKASIYSPDKIEIGDNTRIDDFCVLSGKISIGRHVYFAPFCLVNGGEVGVFIEDFSGFSYRVSIFSQSDDYLGYALTNPTVPDKFKKETKKMIEIGRHVGIGTGSVVFPGVKLAEGCTVGAMSLVRKSTKPWGVYVGNPAKRVIERKKNLLELEKKFLEGSE